MSPSPARRRFAEGDKRQAILDAALALFGERGFHGTAVPAVAERAGVGAGTIYRYFASKEALVNALYREWKQRLASHVVLKIDPSAKPREQFRALWFGIAEFAGLHPDGFNFLEMHHHGSYLDEDSRALESRVLDLTSAFVSRLQQARVVKAMDPMAIMAMVYWAFVGLSRCSQEGRLDLNDQTLESIEECLWQAISR